MTTSQQCSSATLVVVITVLLVPLAFATGAMAQSSDTVVELNVSDAPEAVEPGDDFSVVYSVNNVGSQTSSYTIDVADRSPNVTVTEFSGDIRASDTDGDPPSASTDAIDPGETGTVTISYTVAENASISETVGVVAREPLVGSTDEAESTISVVEQEPESATELSVATAPDVVTQGNGIAVDYEFSTNDSALTIELADPTSGLSVESFTGAIESQDLAGSPPTATTEFVESGKNATFSVEYRIEDELFGPNENRTNQTIELAATNAVENETDHARVSITLQKPETTPNDPVDRAEQIADVDDSSEISQNNVTEVITRFERRQAANDIDIVQNDITTMITLFERD